MIFRAALACIAILGILALGEWLWRHKITHGEYSRKFAHIVAGTFIAFLPFWLSYDWVTILGVGFVLANLANRFNILNNFLHLLKRPFRAFYTVTRKSYGDIFLALAILICSILEPAPWVFATAILFVSLSDGLAAIAGVNLAKKFGGFYYVLYNRKSYIGSAVFLVVSVTILSAAIGAEYGWHVGAHWLTLVWLPIITVVIENSSGYGLDNLLLPIAVVLALRPLQL